VAKQGGTGFGEQSTKAVVVVTGEEGCDQVTPARVPTAPDRGETRDENAVGDQTGHDPHQRAGDMPEVIRCFPVIDSVKEKAI
jgi:hypothetical protein